MWTILLVIVAVALAIMGGFNTVMDFYDRMNSYHKALKERRTTKLLKNSEAQPELRQLGSVGRRLIQESFAKRTQRRPLTVYDVDIIPPHDL